MGQGTINRIWKRYVIIAATLIVILVIARSIWLFGGIGKDRSSAALYKKLTDSLHYEDLMENSAQSGMNDNMTGQPSNVYRDILKYCNSPANVGLGMEGQEHPGYTLISVTTVIRHGDRTPMNTVPNTKPSWNCRFTQKMLAKNPLFGIYIPYMEYMSTHVNQLRSDIVLKGMKYIPDEEVCGKSELTPLGAMQHLILGSHLDVVYNKEHNLLSEKWSQSDIAIETTQYQRTLQSSLAFLYGFLPAFNFDKFEIKLSEGFNFCQMDCKCPSAYLYEKMVNEEKLQLLKNDEDLKDAIDAVAKILNVGPSYHPYANHLQDALTPFVCHNRRLPCGPRECLHINHLGGIINHTKMVARVTNQDGKPREKFVRLNMHPLLSRIVDSMESSIQGNNRVKFKLFSGHDLTVSPLIDVLGLPDHAWPPYASRVIFELWKENKTSRHFVRVLYNGDDLTKYVRFCGGYSNDVGLCPWQRFADFVRLENLKTFNSTTYKEACYKTSYNTDK
ncbi:2-phosphoxylose phosphatase 1-like [Glandiceps talaboti]